MGIEEYLGEDLLNIKIYLYDSILMLHISMHNEHLHN